MPEDMQPSLFPDQAEQPVAGVVDTSEAARHIAKHAGQPEYEDRTSEAARDQGHGSLDLGSTEHIPGSDTERAQARARRTHPAEGGAKVYELPGKNGRRNTPGVATRAEVQRGLSDEEIDRRKRVNRAGAAAARAALKGTSQQ